MPFSKVLVEAMSTEAIVDRVVVNICDDGEKATRIKINRRLEEDYGLASGDPALKSTVDEILSDQVEGAIFRKVGRSYVVTEKGLAFFDSKYTLRYEGEAGQVDDEDATMCEDGEGAGGGDSTLVDDGDAEMDEEGEEVATGEAASAGRKGGKDSEGKGEEGGRVEARGKKRKAPVVAKSAAASGTRASAPRAAKRRKR